MSVYYEDDLVTLYHGDCMTETDWTTADVLITDPPYGMSYVSNFSKYAPTDAIAGDTDTTLRDRVLEMWGSERAALVFGTWRVERPFAIRQLIIWDKGDTPGMGDLSIPWGPSHEDIYALGQRGFTGKRTGAVLRVPTMGAMSAKRPNHPTPKPVPLMELLVAKTKGTIADPFTGSGATLLAAKNLGRRAIGVEIDERYCEMTALRLAQGVFDFGELV